MTRYLTGPAVEQVDAGDQGMYLVAARAVAGASACTRCWHVRKNGLKHQPHSL